jgi:hypothetical protein
MQRSKGLINQKKCKLTILVGKLLVRLVALKFKGTFSLVWITKLMVGSKISFQLEISLTKDRFMGGRIEGWCLLMLPWRNNRLERTLRVRSKQRHDSQDTSRVASKQLWGRKINLQFMLVLKVILKALGIPTRLNNRLKYNQRSSPTSKLGSCLLF